MIAKKVAKHKLILKNRLHQKTTVTKMAKVENATLQLFLDAFTRVKSKDFSADDISAFKRCETYRQSLLKDKSEINYEVFGLNETAIVSEICKKAASKAKWCQLLYGIAKTIDNPSILEIGTNLGISGTYLLEAIKGKNGYFITMEGLPELCKIAGDQFKTIVNSNSFEVIQGLYEDTFKKVLQKTQYFNLLFIDGNHKKAPTLQYFNDLKSKMTSPAILIFDDIYWSEDMKDAWDDIKNDTDVNFTIDLYEQGVVILDKNESTKNQHFSLHLSY
ncbi:class I SAM-dependent methyltransferase [Hyunsoonleella flava]|uniref:Class I SAM-dependent methyltransferase n=1 Tax=Hyunsoonleella flava TaxID=2527939 RepID=A0A4Q9FF22_9FLAO|nr:class I SAM-dependent methyltransferase [Hyunsoonleella flava]TBN02388.1 class I SAM-dependent methyltransferase [Hyunsoonleella flava]